MTRRDEWMLERAMCGQANLGFENSARVSFVSASRASTATCKEPDLCFGERPGEE